MTPEALMYDIIVNTVRYTPQPGHYVLDLGAHYGYFSLYCAARGAHVTAYEPLEENYRELVRISRDIAPQLGFPTIITHRQAVTDAYGERLLWYNRDNPGASSLLRQSDFDPVPVSTVPLSAALRMPDLPDMLWDCVKVDVEGAEAEIFLAASNMDLKRIRFLTMELHNDVLSLEQHDALYKRMLHAFPKSEAQRNGDRVVQILCWS